MTLTGEIPSPTPALWLYPFISSCGHPINAVIATCERYNCAGAAPERKNGNLTSLARPAPFAATEGFPDG
jgi:hypothetical protein